MTSLFFHSSLPPYLVSLPALEEGDCLPRLSSEGTELSVRLRVDAEAGVRCVFLRTVNDGEEAFVEMTKIPLAPEESFRRVWGEAGAQWWEARYTPHTDLFHYRFQILGNEGQVWHYGAGGATSYTPNDCLDFKACTLSAPPAWIYEAVFYQIFPDRFANGRPELSVKDAEYSLEGKAVEQRQWTDELQPDCGNREFFGGDLYGIIDHLDYLEDLGVNSLYLNPIFDSPSNHKYDVADYYRVDPHLGGNAGLEALRQATAQRHMRLILDIIPNHCGQSNWWFRKAQSDPNSPEYSFFNFNSYPDDYECWLNYRSLPRLNYACGELRRRMYAGEDSIFKRWLRPPYAIDGWRLDVANMLANRGTSQWGHRILQEMRQAVKETNPQAWLLGEHFFDGTPYLQSDALDATMNYRGFTFPLHQWLCGKDFPAFKGKDWGINLWLTTPDLRKQLDNFRALVPELISLGQLNMLGSHDLPRILTLTEGQSGLVKTAALLLFAYQGVPCIYYGDEVGMRGGCDPQCRRPMIWEREKQDASLHEWFRKLAHLRRRHPALKYGSLQMLYSADNTLVFMRETCREAIIVTVSREGPHTGENLAPAKNLDLRAAQLPEGTILQGLMSGASVIVEDGKAPILPSAGQAEMWLALPPEKVK